MRLGPQSSTGAARPARSNLRSQGFGRRWKARAEWTAEDLRVAYRHASTYPQELPPKSEGCTDTPWDVMDAKGHEARLYLRLAADQQDVLAHPGIEWDGLYWRLGAESNRCTRLCRPLHHHSAT